MNANTQNLLEKYYKKIFQLKIPDKNIIGILDLIEFKELVGLDCSGNQITSIINLPNSLKYIKCYENATIRSLKLPIELEWLCIDYNDMELLKMLPKNLLRLTICFDYRTKNKPIQFDYLSPSLKHLKINGCYDNSIDDISYRLPDLLYLGLGANFNQIILNLPPKLICLIFGYSFNNPVPNLPNNLKYLTFGYSFNQLVDELPLSLTHITFGYSFSQPISNLPIGLTHLVMGESFNNTLSNLPKNLIYLVLKKQFNQPVPILPPNLTHLVLSRNFNQTKLNLPPKLTNLTLGWAFNQKIIFEQDNLINMDVDLCANVNSDTNLTLNYIIIPSSIVQLSCYKHIKKSIPKKYHYKIKFI